MKLTLAQLAALAAKHGFPDPELAAAVAMAESVGNAGAVNDTSSQTVFPAGVGPERSIGLWQINVLPGANPQYASWNLTDPDVNAQAAFQISQGGRVWAPWSTYNNGAYRAYYRSAANDFHRVRPPLARPSSVPAVLAAAVLAAAAGYVVSQRRRVAL